MTNCIILTHAYIRPHEEYKIAPIEFAVKHYRHNNPNDYLMLLGHGIKPNVDCDYMYWEDPVNEKDINVGHPRLCNMAYDHAAQKGFKKVLKTRSDSIHLIRNLCEFADDKLQNKKILVTQQTRIDKPQVGDLFMYGDLDFLKLCWNIDKWYPTKTGVTSLANNLQSVVRESSWRDCCINHLRLIDIYNLKWICLQKNWKNIFDNMSKVMENDMPDWHESLWGSRQKWHVWSKDGELIYSKPKVGKITTEKDWI